VVTIQFPLDRCPLHKESTTLSIGLGKEERGLSLEIAFPGSARARLLARGCGSGPEGGWQVGRQQLSEDYFMVIDLSHSLENTSKHFSEVFSLNLLRSNVFIN